MTIRAGMVVYERPAGAAPQGSTDTTIYDLLFKHARLGSEDVDIGVIGNRVARIGHGLKAAHAKVLVEAEGYQAGPVELREGAAADIRLMDSNRAILTVRNGRILTDDLGLSITDVSRAGPYSNFK